MIPLVKDTHGNHGDVSNYRGITISLVISKLFEHILRCVFADHLKTSTYQFGFKRKNSTSHALHSASDGRWSTTPTMQVEFIAHF